MLCWSTLTTQISCEWLFIVAWLCVQTYNPLVVASLWHNSALSINKHYCLVWSRHGIDSSVSVYRNSLFFKAIDIKFNVINSKFPLLTTGKVITYVITSKFMYLFLYVCMYACMYVNMYACMYVCIYYICMCICMYVCMYACMYICMYVGHKHH